LGEKEGGEKENFANGVGSSIKRKKKTVAREGQKKGGRYEILGKRGSSSPLRVDVQETERAAEEFRGAFKEL